MLNSWLMKQKRDAEEAELRLQANFQRTEKRIAGRDDLDEAQKAVIPRTCRRSPAIGACF